MYRVHYPVPNRKKTIRGLERSTMSIKLAFFGCLHASDRPPLGRKDDYRQAILNKLQMISGICAEQDVAYAFVTGDLFHNKRPNRVSHALVQELMLHFQLFPCPVYVVPGNHDLGPDELDSLERQPLGVLARSEAVRWLLDAHLLAKEGDKGSQTWVVSRPYSNEGDADPNYYALREEEMSRMKKAPRPVIVVAHGSVLAPGDERPYPYVNVDQIPGIKQVKLFVGGHIHEDLGIHNVDGTIFANVGSIARTARTQANYTRKVQMLIATINEGEEVTVESVEIPGVAPALEVFEGKEVDTPEVPNDEIQKFVERLGQGLRSEELTIDELLAGVEDNDVKALVKQLLEEAS
jgi:DNA repair exonuclease SbcCD nuclease subunit